MKRHQYGLSLVELMVAIVISSLLVLGVTEIFSRSFFADRDNTELTHMQESGRLALEIIGQDARRAGFQGCVESDTPNSESGTTLPGGAVSWANNSLTFVYFEPDDKTEDGICALDGQWMTITYTSSNAGISRQENAAPAQPILDNAQFAQTPDFLPTGDPATARSITVHIAVSDTRTAGDTLAPRTFSTTYELRNRL
jgi:prepilin-type N-terminal cleavage/methylation domain-containing protein